MMLNIDFHIFEEGGVNQDTSLKGFEQENSTQSLNIVQNNFWNFIVNFKVHLERILSLISLIKNKFKEIHILVVWAKFSTDFLKSQYIHCMRVQ